MKPTPHWAAAKKERAIRRRWTAKDLAFLKENCLTMSYSEIGQHLARSDNAIKIKIIKLRLPRPTKNNLYWTANEVANALAVDIHAVVLWHKRGLLAFHIAPTRKRQVLRIKRMDVYRFVYDPQNWPLFRYTPDMSDRRLADPVLAELVERRQSRWHDRWLSIGQAAALIGYKCSNSLNLRIHQGYFPSAMKWGNWRILESDVLKFKREHHPSF